MRQPDNQNHGYESIDDPQLRALANALADNIDAEARALIIKAYTDPGIKAQWAEMRKSGRYQKGSKTQRQVFEIPVIVKDFLDDYFGDPDWIKNKKLWRHDLVKPWLIVEKI